MIGFVEPSHFGFLGILLGLVFLLFGRKLFWFLIAALGFYIGLLFATDYLNLANDWNGVIIGLCCGVAGVVLLYLIQKVALSVLGFLLWVFLTFNIMQHFRFPFHWWVILIGGIAGLIVAASLFHVAIIFLSSLFGSYMVVHELPLDASSRATVFLLLACIGCVVQFSMMRRHRKKQDQTPKSGRSAGEDSAA